ncbi:YkgJ family cysteine cluster protein [Acidianus sp. HS-5]|uniref:YkgJ family cysteine cluster protein n=1 Tax=Acidianus sp. HS-5 TaxID=2886040 RepID=UPI001F2B7782|nr:YkgJ family cysteine cluster protein [Acidianus sp. HS-5]BDC17945.1 zinc/iron-chelating domain-containing protein [Acidianus sp. HS-5]
MNTDEVNILTKKALRSDVESLRKIVNFLAQYNAPIAKYAIYSIIYQFAMNNVIDLGKECETCGGKCCKEGYPVPVYGYDFKEMKKNMKDLRLEKKNGFYLLPRPCQFQKGWICTINSFKPYACLSYPFATEDEQEELLKSYDGKGVPNFKVPEFCIAGKKVKDFMDKVIEELKKEKGREPSPLEIVDKILEIYQKMKKP